MSNKIEIYIDGELAHIFEREKEFKSVSILHNGKNLFEDLKKSLNFFDNFMNKSVKGQSSEDKE